MTSQFNSSLFGFNEVKDDVDMIHRNARANYEINVNANVNADLDEDDDEAPVDDFLEHCARLYELDGLHP
ncbi:hypothetical protein [Caballeronia telluris]|uniref:Uncharacterized protein n=1 Tax=Caballeronia telluris TaxID=326475 RepID=A0A158FJJ5_9BURK|nr:hypothetical protein [Caballeronia telluris]SAL19489.1 hypothetical protein AWB66_00938 [Caballeronia telluris]